MRISLIALILSLMVNTARAQRQVTDPSDLGGIVGRVTLPSGHSIGGHVRITLRTMLRPLMTLSPDGNGEFRIMNLRDGIYHVDVIGDPKIFEPFTQEVEISRGRQVTLAVYLREKNITVTHVKAPNGNVVSAAELDQNVPAGAKKEYQQAVKLIAKGDADAAIRRLLNAIASYPAYLAARERLGAEYHKLKRFTEAAEQFQIVIKMNPHAFNSQLHLGIMLVEGKNYPEAISHLKAAISTNGSHPNAHLYFGIALLGTDQLPDAYGELSKALILGGSEYSVAHYYMAFIHSKRGEPNEAAGELKLYLESSPSGELADHARMLLDKLK